LNIHFISNLVVMTNKKGAGGAREGAGRKPKILEVKLIEQMDAICVPDKIWEALLMKCAQGDTAALKLWLSYRFGLPKQQIDVTSNGEKIAPPIQWIGRNAAIEAAKVINEESDEIESDWQQIETFGDNTEQNEREPQALDLQEKNNWF
jgi:hypothetical protein